VNNDTILWIAIISVAAVWYLRSRGARVRAQEEIRERMARPAEGVESSREVAEPKPAALSDEEAYARDAAEMAGKWEREQREAEKAQHAAMQPMREKIAKAEKLIKQSGVGESCCDLIEKTSHWSSWLKRQDWHPPNLMTDVSAEERGWLQRWVAWTYGGTKYRLELDAHNAYEGEGYFGNLALSVNNAPVLDITVSGGGEFIRWHMIGVNAFRAGPWMVQVNDLAGQLRNADRAATHGRDLDRTQETANRIDL